MAKSLEETREYAREYQRKRRQKPEYREYMRKYYRRNKNKWRRLKEIYISDEAADALLQSQNNRCAICRKKQEPHKKAFGVDHDHVTHRIRGVLCNNCNAGLGFFKDDLVILKAAVVYLEKG